MFVPVLPTCVVFAGAYTAVTVCVPPDVGVKVTEQLRVLELPVAGNEQLAGVKPPPSEEKETEPCGALPPDWISDTVAVQVVFELVATVAGLQITAVVVALLSR